MLVPRKIQYALRAVFELAKHSGRGPVKIAEIAKAQAIPARFLEAILNQLKQAGFVDSRRGKGGGYFLTRSPGRLTVGEVMQFMQGPVRAVDCFAGKSKDSCPLFGNCVFLPMWEKVHEAIEGVYNSTTFRDLVDQEVQKQQEGRPDYSI